MPMQDSADGQRSYFPCLDYLRAVAMFLVAWVHLGAQPNPSWRVLQGIEWLFNRPLSLIQDFGALGVSIFLLISGFLMSYNTEKAGRYFIKKFFRIILPIWATWGLAFVFFKIIAQIGYQGYWSQFSGWDWVKSAAFYSLSVENRDVINPNLWFVIPLIFSYLFFFIYKLCNRFIRIGFVPFSLIMLLLINLLANYLPVGISENSPFVIPVLFGYMIGLVKQKRIFIGKLTLWAGLCYFTMIIGFWKFRYEFYEESPYAISVMFSVMIFWIVSSLPPPPPPRRGCGRAFLI